MTKEEISEELARELISSKLVPRIYYKVLGGIILDKLTEILNADKGRLTDGTIKQ